MSINFEDTTLDAILAEYPTDANGIGEVVEFLNKTLDAGFRADDEAVAADIVEGFRQGLDLLGSLPADLLKGKAGAIIHATRYLVDVADAARAAGRKVTLRSLGVVVSNLGLDFIQHEAAAGYEEAIEAVALAKSLGLL